MIASLQPEHAKAVAAIHSATLPGLLTRLGPAAVEAYYTGCTRSNLAIGMVYVERSAVRGFVLGSVHPDRLQAEVLRKNLIATLASLAQGVLSHPSALGWLVRSLSGPDVGSYDARTPSLIYLSVDTDHRRGGAGRQLVDSFSDRLAAAGAMSYDLSVDSDNAPAIAFYERLGFRRLGDYHEFGVLHRRYRLALR